MGYKVFWFHHTQSTTNAYIDPDIFTRIYFDQEIHLKSAQNSMADLIDGFLNQFEEIPPDLLLISIVDQEISFAEGVKNANDSILLTNWQWIHHYVTNQTEMKNVNLPEDMTASVTHVKLNNQQHYIVESVEKYVS